MPTVTVNYSNSQFSISPDPIPVAPGSQTIDFQSSDSGVKIVSFEVEGNPSPNPFSWSNPSQPSSSLSVGDNNSTTTRGNYGYTLTVEVGTSQLRTRSHQITNESER